MDITQNIPKAMIEKYPQLPTVFEALLQYKNGKEIMAKCPKCGEVVVNEVKETGTIEVNCDCGYLLYREKHNSV